MELGFGLQDELLIDAAIAQKINQFLGGALVGPWDVDTLDPNLIDVVMALANDLPGIQKGLGVTKNVIDRWKSEHPTYRKG